MKNRKLLTLAGAAALLAFAAGCAKAPQKEMDEAKAAVEAAKAAGADLYAKEQFDAATGAWTAAEAEVKAQDAKMPLVRNYDGAKKSLAACVTSANAAKDAAAAGKEAAKSQAEAAVNQAKAGFAEAKKMVDSLAKKKKKVDDKMKAEWEACVANMSKAETCLSAGDYSGAQSAAQMVVAAVEAHKNMDKGGKKKK